jgi:hypothetical protein
VPSDKHCNDPKLTGSAEGLVVAANPTANPAAGLAATAATLAAAATRDESTKYRRLVNIGLTTNSV